jgi:integrase/recombinase XerC
MSESPRDKFIDYLHYEKRFSPHTVTAYNTDLEQFAQYLQATYSLDDIQHVTHTLIRSWAASMLENKLTARSVNRKLTTLKTFYKYLMKHGLITINPMLKVQSPKTSKRLPVFVEKERMDMLLDNASEALVFDNSFEGIRDRLILELFYGCGIRLAELINLQTVNVDLYKGQIKVLGKRNKERIIPVNTSLKAALKAYLMVMKNLNISNAEGFLLCNEKGKKLYEKLVYTLVNRYLSMVTTLDKKSPHVLRHTFATHMLNSGADINAIKELLGHTSLSATQVYTHNTVEKLKNIHKQAHPKA